jgi:hypothetical protein
MYYTRLRLIIVHIFKKFAYLAIKRNHCYAFGCRSNVRHHLCCNCKQILPTAIFILLLTNTLEAQEHTDNFKRTIFINSQDEYPYCISIGGGIGPGTQGATGGLIADLDIYHILVGYKLIKHGILLPKDHKQATENSFYFGYQYRTKKIMSSIAAGIGSIQFKCTSGINGNCYGIDESKSKCIPMKWEFDYLLSPYFGLGVSANSTFTKHTNLYCFLFHVKFGIFWSEEY